MTTEAVSSLVTVRSPGVPVRVSMWSAVHVVGRQRSRSCSSSLYVASKASATTTTAPLPPPPRARPRRPPPRRARPSPAPMGDRRARSVGLDPAALQQSRRRPRTASRTASSSCATARSRASGTSAARGPDTTQNVFSVTKSITSTLVGIAQDDGDLAHRRPRLDVDPGVEGHAVGRGHGAATCSATTRAGSGASPSTTSQLLARPTGPRSRSGSRQTAAPGTVWAYNNSAIQTLQRVVQQAHRRATSSTSRSERLFAPLGMTHTRDDDRRGRQRADVRGHAVDLPRPGALRLADARPRQWGGTQIVSRDWVEAGDGQVVDRAQRRLRLPVVAQPQGHVASPLAATSLRAARRRRRRRGRLVARRAATTCSGRSGSATRSCRSIPGTGPSSSASARRAAPAAADVRARRGEQGRHRSCHRAVNDSSR